MSAAVKGSRAKAAQTAAKIKLPLVNSVSFAQFYIAKLTIATAGMITKSMGMAQEIRWIVDTYSPL
jgi:hypothetical protein